MVVVVVKEEEEATVTPEEARRDREAVGVVVEEERSEFLDFDDVITFGDAIYGATKSDILHNYFFKNRFRISFLLFRDIVVLLGSMELLGESVMGLERDESRISDSVESPFSFLFGGGTKGGRYLATPSNF